MDDHPELCGNAGCWCADDAAIAKAILFTRTSHFTRAELDSLAKWLRKRRYLKGADRIEKARGSRGN